MNDLQRMTGTPMPFRAADGKEYLIGPLTPAALAELEAWVEDFPLAKAYRRIKKFEALMSEAERKVIMQQAYDELEASSGLAEEGTSIGLESVAGLQQLLFLCLRDHNEDMTPEKAAGLVMLDSMTELKRILDTVNGLKLTGGDNDDSDDTDPKVREVGTEI